MLTTARTASTRWAAAITAAPPKEWPTSSWTARPVPSMKRTASAVSPTLWEKEPSPQSPSEAPSPRLSKRSMPMPSLASCLQMRLAAGESFPRVKPWAKTPHPRTVPWGRSTRPASRGPLVLGNHTRSATGPSCQNLVPQPAVVSADAELLIGDRVPVGRGHGGVVEPGDETQADRDADQCTDLEGQPAGTHPGNLTKDHVAGGQCAGAVDDVEYRHGRRQVGGAVGQLVGGHPGDPGDDHCPGGPAQEHVDDPTVRELLEGQLQQSGDDGEERPGRHAQQKGSAWWPVGEAGQRREEDRQAGTCRREGGRSDVERCVTSSARVGGHQEDREA